MRYLIVNADDFGFSRSVNRGIVDAYEGGIVTSASLMVDRPAAEDAARYARAQEDLDLGLHVELRQWRVALLPRRGAAWSTERVRRHVRSEMSRQLERFHGLVQRDPTHLDSHQHRHLGEVPRPLFEEAARKLRVPLRRTGDTVNFCGDFYGHDAGGCPRPAAITADALVEIVETLPEGVTELCCHPGYADDLRDWYRGERELEVKALCDPRVRAAVERDGIRLCTVPEAMGLAREAVP